MRLSYLAAPYTHADPSVVEQRIAAFCRVDAALSRRGIFTVSPLLKHLVLQHSDLPGDWIYWKDYSTLLMSRCDKMYIITLPGWEESTGVQAEIKLCEEFDLPIEYLDEEGS